MPSVVSSTVDYPLVSFSVVVVDNTSRATDVASQAAIHYILYIFCSKGFEFQTASHVFKILGRPRTLTTGHFTDNMTAGYVFSQPAGAQIRTVDHPRLAMHRSSSTHTEGVGKNTPRLEHLVQGHMDRKRDTQIYIGEDLYNFLEEADPFAAAAAAKKKQQQQQQQKDRPPRESCTSPRQYLSVYPSSSPFALVPGAPAVGYSFPPPQCG
jgi:hypothetical protein